MSIDSATDGELCLAYVVNVLVPILRRGDIVVLDNLGAHKNSAVEIAIRAVGATVEYLPAYSPDLNPIEKMWSKIKAVLRALKVRTSRALDTAIRRASHSVTPDDALSWFASCGYTLI